MPQRADIELGFWDFGVVFVLSCCLFFVGFFPFIKEIPLKCWHQIPLNRPTTKCVRKNSLPFEMTNSSETIFPFSAM